jgi:formylglycine-generating enzyme
MLRRRVFLRVGWLLTLLVIVTVTAGSRAAPTGESSAVPEPRVERLELLPRLAIHDALHAPLFGSFIRPGTAPEALPSENACAPDMVEVEGDYCPLVQQKCLRWVDHWTKLQCAEFEKNPQSTCAIKTQHKHFCIDRYEWPNQLGATPTFMASWKEAKASCEAVGKRLCGDTEWTLACEGPQRQPYPYGDGYERDAEACNIDKPYVWPHADRIFNARTEDDELSRLDQREPSGSRPACVSPYGVHDMVGNVDEWVVNVSQFGHPHESALKGGYWGPVRTRCRPMTTEHPETFRYYQTGFRCCDSAHAVEVGDAPLATL